MNETQYIKAQAHMHHAYFLGLQLMVSAHNDKSVMYDWMFRLFRQQHLDKFLSSFDKLGVTGEPDAVACAKYHVMSNSVGGVPVEYMYESDTKAWVRFRYPRWMYHGPTLCGLPPEVGHGFLRGWYAHNGVSLENPRLGYVCVSEDLTGEFGFCGYFKEYDHDLTDDERLQFSKEEMPPPFKAEEQPQLPNSEWNESRLEKANRNYAVEYIRNGLVQLASVIGEEETRALGRKAARLIGLQYLRETREMIDVADGDLDTGADYLVKMMSGLGDECEVAKDADGITVSQTGLRIVRGLPAEDAKIILDSWCDIWTGTMSSFTEMKKLEAEVLEDRIEWRITTQRER